MQKKLLDLKSLFSFFILLITILITSCGKLNKGYENDFSEEGCIIQNAVKPVNPHYGINFFLETSGSMFGFMPGNHNTGFQDQVWDILSYFQDARNTKVKLFQITAKDKAPDTLNFLTFRKDMNLGKFKSVDNTDIPEMIDVILARTDKNAVSILTSDLVFSPADSTPALMSEISSDIRSRFANKGYGCELIQSFSGFYKHDKTYVPVSPYYFWIVGSPANVADAARQLKSRLPKFNEIAFGLPGPVVAYTLEPYEVPNPSASPSVCTENGSYYSYSGWDKSTTPIDLCVAMDLSDLTADQQTPAYVKNNFKINDDAFQAKLLSVIQPSTLKDKQDKELAEKIKATTLLNIRIQGLQGDGGEIKLNFAYKRPIWVSQYNTEQVDYAHLKTSGIEKLIAGLEQAYAVSDDLLTRPIKILITKQEN